MPLLNVFLPNHDRLNHHHCTLHPSNQQPMDHVQSANERLVAASVSFGLATVGTLLAPPLLYGCIPAIAYLTARAAKDVYQTVTTDMRLDRAMVECALLGCSLVQGYYVIGSFASVIYYQGRKSWHSDQPHSTLSTAPAPSSRVTPGNRPVGCSPPLYTRVQRMDGKVEVLVTALQPEDIVLVQAGEVIPVAGRIIRGRAWIAAQANAPDAKMLIKRPGNHVQADQLVLAGSIAIALQRTKR